MTVGPCAIGGRLRGPSGCGGFLSGRPLRVIFAQYRDRAGFRARRPHSMPRKPRQGLCCPSSVSPAKCVTDREQPVASTRLARAATSGGRDARWTEPDMSQSLSRGMPRPWPMLAQKSHDRRQNSSMPWRKTSAQKATDPTGSGVVLDHALASMFNPFPRIAGRESRMAMTLQPRWRHGNKARAC